MAFHVAKAHFGETRINNPISIVQNHHLTCGGEVSVDKGG